MDALYEIVLKGHLSPYMLLDVFTSVISSHISDDIGKIEPVFTKSGIPFTIKEEVLVPERVHRVSDDRLQLPRT